MTSTPSHYDVESTLGRLFPDVISVSRPPNRLAFDIDFVDGTRISIPYSVLINATSYYHALRERIECARALRALAS